MMKYYLAPWKKYADFRGRAQRAEYWVYGLGNFLIAIILVFAGAAISGGNENIAVIPYALFILAMIIPNLAVSFRRLHDTGRSGWWLLINIIPLVGGIWFFVLAVLDSQPGENKYGPNPKGQQLLNSSGPSDPNQTVPEGVKMS